MITGDLCNKISNFLDHRHYLRLGEVEIYSKKYNSVYIGSIYIFKQNKFYKIVMSSITSDDCQRVQQLTFMLSSRCEFDSVYEALTNTRLNIRKYLNCYGTREVSEDEFYECLENELE